MSPLNSYPEVMAEVRVIVLKDQSERTDKTLYKASTLNINIDEELDPKDCNIPVKGLYTSINLLHHFGSALRYTQTSNQLNISDNLKLIHSKPFTNSCRTSLLQTSAIRSLFEEF